VGLANLLTFPYGLRLQVLTILPHEFRYERSWLLIEHCSAGADILLVVVLLVESPPFCTGFLFSFVVLYKTLLRLPSPIQAIVFKKQLFFIKRDDLIHLWLNGNKARKFYAYLHTDFPGIDTLVSYGGNQSNAMLALSALARLRGWSFRYYGKALPQVLHDEPIGNFRAALENGMEYIAVQNFDFSDWRDNELFVPQGGADALAELGVAMLAKEIKAFVRLMGLQKLGVILASGTGTTALFLQKHLQNTDIQVSTVPCVGDATYLRQQFVQLQDNLSLKIPPHILNPQKHYRFGQLYPEFLALWQDLKNQTGIEFDLLYDPLTWQTLLEQRDTLYEHVLYIHCGGVNGNESMLRRYKRSFGVTSIN